MALEPLFLDLIQVYRDAYQALLDKLTDQELRGLSTNHTRALLSEIDDIIAQLKQYQSDWINHTIPLGYQEGSDAVVDKLTKRYGMTDINVSFGGVHTQAVQAIIQDTFNDIAAATDYMAENLKQAIRDAAKEKYRIGLITGETRRSMTKGLTEELNRKGFTAYYDAKDRYIPLREYANILLEEQWVGFIDKAGRRWDLMNYSEMLCRTKALEASNRGTENRLTANNLDLVLITSHGASDWCKFFENRVFSISGTSSEYPPLSEVPNHGCPMHPRCVAGGALVTGPRPIMSFSRWFEGEVVVIRTASGNELTVTPNHPILTPKGWVAAGLLNEGNQVVRYLGKQGVMDTVDPNYIDVPTLIEEVANSFNHSSSVSTCSVPVSAEDFHGDGKGSDICIIRSNSLLRNEGNVTVNEPASENSFGFANIWAMILYAKGAATKLLERLFFATNGFMRSGRQSGTSCFIKACKSSFHCFGSISGSVNTKFGQTSLNGAFINSKRFRDIFLSFPGLVAIKDLLIIKRQPIRSMGFLRTAQRDSKINKPSAESSFSNSKVLGEAIQTFTSQIAFDTIVHINRHSFAGHVYNLQTKYNWYACNTIITHNCKHSETPFIEKFETEEMVEYGKGIDKKYLGLNTEGHADQAALRKLERTIQSQ